MFWEELIIEALVRVVFHRYDPNFIATSLDEAYLNITDVCTERGITGEEVIMNISICHSFLLLYLSGASG